MAKEDPTAALFEQKRTHLRAVAYRMLGRAAEADDAVQEAWLRISRAGTAGVDNLGGFMTTVVARVCLDMLRTRKSRGEEHVDSDGAEPHAVTGAADSPEHDTLVADSVGLALIVVLETLAPAERLAFVLHDMFDLPFEEIAGVIGCAPPAARQLASRARRRVQGRAADPDADADLARQREVVDAFLVASRSGDLTALMAALDPEIVLRADHVALAASAAMQNRGAPRLAVEVRGAAAVAASFVGRAQAARPTLIDGSLGLAWAPGGKPRVVFAMTIANGKITAIDVIAQPLRLSELALTLIDD